MINNDLHLFRSGKTYFAGKDFKEGLIELKPIAKHTSGKHYRITDYETNQTNTAVGVFDSSEYIKITKGSTLELYDDVIINTYIRESHHMFSPGFYEAGESFRAGLVGIINRKKAAIITIHDGDSFKPINSVGSPANTEFYLTIEKGQMLRTDDESTELIEYRRI